MKFAFRSFVQALVWAAALAAGSAQADLTTGLIAYYPLAGNTNDSSPNGYNGIASNVTYGSAPTGQGAVFNGTSSAVTASVPSGVVPSGNASRSVSFWVKWNGGQNGNMVSMGYGASQINHRYSALVQPNGYMAIIGNWNDYTSTNFPLTPGVWVNVAITYDGSTLVFYRNGVQVDSLSVSPGFQTNDTATIWLGRNPDGGEFLGGSLAQVRIFNRALSAADVAEQAGFPVVTTGSASSVTSSGATLNGVVNDNGTTTTASFDLGLTTSYGTVLSATPASILAAAGNTAVSGVASGLNCATTYHFRVKGVNASGTTNGSDATFTTGSCIPATPTIGTATAGDRQASVAFTPLSDPSVTSYTVTSSPGNISASGTTSPIVVAGLQAGTSYTFTVKANSGSNSSPASSASNSVTPFTRYYAGQTPGGSNASATLSGGGATCAFSQAAFVSPSSQGLTLPPGYVMNQGLFKYTLTGCDTSTVTMSVNYAAAPGSVYWKYGKTSDTPSAHWYQLNTASFSGNTVTFTIRDGGVGDDDLTVNGTIVDPGGPASVSTDMAPVPALSPRGMLALGGLMVLFGAFSLRRQRR